MKRAREILTELARSLERELALYTQLKKAASRQTGSLLRRDVKLNVLLVEVQQRVSKKITQLQESIGPFVQWLEARRDKIAKRFKLLVETIEQLLDELARVIREIICIEQRNTRLLLGRM